MRASECLGRARESLASHSIPDAFLEAEVLVRHAMDTDRAAFFASLHDHLTPKQEARVGGLVRRRMAGEPLAHILGFREFYGLEFMVNPSVLVPRQETELLVDTVLEYAQSRTGENLVITDVGTGCGAIAVTIAYHVPRARIYATDSSREALAVADVNRRRHGVQANVHLRHGDLLSPLNTPADVIVSNPPYLRSAQIPLLAEEVKSEPLCALDGGPDGLGTIRRLLWQAPGYLRPNGLLLVEVAPEQLESVLQIAGEAFPGAKVSFASDLLGLPRVISVEKAAHDQNERRT